MTPDSEIPGRRLISPPERVRMRNQRIRRCRSWGDLVHSTTARASLGDDRLSHSEIARGPSRSLVEACSPCEVPAQSLQSRDPSWRKLDGNAPQTGCTNRGDRNASRSAFNHHRPVMRRHQRTSRHRDNRAQSAAERSSRQRNGSSPRQGPAGKPNPSCLGSADELRTAVRDIRQDKCLTPPPGRWRGT